MSVLLNGFGIVITRPLDQAKNLSILIEQQGGKAISFPLIAISPLSDYTEFEQNIKQLRMSEWVIFISSNAVDSGMPQIINQYKKLPAHLKFAAIGPQTAQHLSSYGIQHVLIPDVRFDSEALLALPQMHTVKDQRIVIVRGKGGRELLAETLIARGAKVSFAECYQRINPQNDCMSLKKLWLNQKCHAIVVTSSEAMRHLLNMTNQGRDDWIRNIKICVNHARIAEEARLVGLQVNIASASGDEAMINCLKRSLLP